MFQGTSNDLKYAFHINTLFWPESFFKIKRIKKPLNEKKNDGRKNPFNLKKLLWPK